MSGGGVENHWRLRGGGEWLFNYPFFPSYTGYGPLLI